MNNFHQALHKLTTNNASDIKFDERLQKNILEACEILNINPNFENIFNFQNSQDSSIRWKYISLSFHILLLTKNDDSLISINYINDIKKLFQFIISLGILPNVLPGVGISLVKRLKNVDKIPTESLTINEQYYRLSGTVRGLLSCIKLISLRNFIISNHFNDLLASLFQLCYAPIKKPIESTVVKKDNEFIMTKSFYNEIMNNRQYFQLELNTLLSEIYSPHVIQELMFFYGNTYSPKWLKSIVYKILLRKLQANDGVESLIKTVLDFDVLDTGTKWKQYDIIVKLLMTKPIQFDEKYFENICTQIVNLLNKNNNKTEINNNFIKLVASCIKYLYEKDKNICEKYFLQTIFSKLTQYSTSNCLNTDKNVKTNEITQITSLVFNIFVESSPTLQPLPIILLKPILAILFHIFVIINKKLDSKLIETFKSIFVKYLTLCNERDKEDMFESFLFAIEKNNILQVNDYVEINLKENDIEIKTSTVKIRLNALDRSGALLDIVKDKNTSKIIIPLFIYLLDTSIIIYSTTKPRNTDFLHLENDNLLLMDRLTERKLVSYKLLSNLIEDSNVHKHLQEHPENIIKFIENTLKQFVDNNLHKSVSCDSEEYQNMFKLIILLNIISEKVAITDSLLNILKLILNETSNIEMKMLISKICHSEISSSKPLKEKSVYEKALEDICDPLLPIRGHGLMTLAKLIEEKNPEICNNKQYILNISQQFLKSEDSYIYLNAVKVLAALGNTFPDAVLSTLTEEYSTGSKELIEKNCETRMKLGEVLIRVIKSLGEIAPKYKAILLNTFLSGVRDEDHLIRTSSLSNLGEVCRVLGFKLGSVVSEVLMCIHAVIATDKAVEARRAAVSVIRYLFVGLEKDTIVFLKDDILPIYRTLKDVYRSDPDDITRLQAQLALEELNANVRDYIFPTVKIEKKIIMLN